MIIKVCGIQNTEEAAGAVIAGANTLGFLIGVPEYVEDKITPEKAKQIIESVPESVRTVMVTHLLHVSEIVKIVKLTGVNTVQIHNQLDIEGINQIRQELIKIEIIKTIHVSDNTAVEEAKIYEPHTDMILLDTKVKDRIGGTGKTHDWNISRQIVEDLNIPVILAGGLNPQNIGEAITSVKPSGVDANSGLENENGFKDFEKIRRYASKAKLLS